MKIILYLLILTFSVNVDWVSDLNLTIEKINKESIIKKEKKIHTEYWQTILKKYKLNGYKKFEIVGESKLADTLNFQYFSKGNFVFAELDFIIAEYIHKGAYYPGRAEGEITEGREYFKNENEGVKLRRSLDYFENSNLDSLKLELQKIKFDTTLLDNEDYLKRKHSLRKFNEML